MFHALIIAVILFVLLSVVSHLASKHGVDVQVFVMRSIMFVMMLFALQVAFWVMVAMWGGDPAYIRPDENAKTIMEGLGRWLDRLTTIQKIMFYATPVYAWLLSFNTAAMFGAMNKSGSAALIAVALGQIANILGLVVPLIIIVLSLFGVMGSFRSYG